ncbi:uncharacterized protein LOC105421323 [Amborella trichopoda]|uniref:uncharacterized protein LOC105421323 n=1 Tax=Amborella trichopoda TaxID=13333 RepID=UPI0005D4455D|nr:uncharacterized protein LOC105421323 [Amborella trichopoda]|eukprot:XP_011626594.1 uncharacterized protein LOC105421323 [Amborella trichopoda]
MGQGSSVGTSPGERKEENRGNNGEKSSEREGDPKNGQSNKKQPHKYEAILAEADSQIHPKTIDELWTLLYSGVFLSTRKKRYWVDEKSRGNCFILFARDLKIVWGEDGRYWRWIRLAETSHSKIEIAELLNVCWFEVRGKIDASWFSPGIDYIVAFIVKLGEEAFGWEAQDVTLSLTCANKMEKTHTQNLEEKERGKWMEIHVGAFHHGVEEKGDIEFSMMHTQDSRWKSGLFIKGVVIRPRKGSIKGGYPHDYKNIIAGATTPLRCTSVEELYACLYSGLLLDNKKKKYWFDEESGGNCFFLFARDLWIVWGEDQRYWRWVHHQESSYPNIEVAELREVCWLEINGKMETSHLTPDTDYTVSFTVKLREGAHGWGSKPVTLCLKYPGGTEKKHTQNMEELEREKWMHLTVGEFHVHKGTKGELSFSLMEIEGRQWKGRLIIQGVQIAPKRLKRENP